jgi:2-oxoglutarate ferredoxin oxidoreductase subunit gamma
MREEIRVTGFGGQGIIMAGFVIGKAATVFDGKFATLIQSYGPEARGSACAAQVVVSDKKILYPYLRSQKTLLALSQEGYDVHHGNTSKDGTILVDSALVEFDKKPDVKVFRTIPSTSIAEEMGRRMVTNIVMLGFFTGVTKIVSVDAMREAIRTTVPKGTEELNIMAFEKGFAHSQEKQKAAAS